ncbi:MAG: hypothetical protein F2672_02770 [Actinobacteria bacterium]|jgi:hypothetical protein|uniref:Unannotated protein n=1 Tax=freshwater metagenome TaxID=449393 RepID=A0A6J6PSV9_9ZZZZ|nr:hypothetical protein [Actinomycetota bacterium]
MTNYRWGGYLLVAMGLLNLRYQTGQPGVVTHSLIILTPGAIILIMSFIPKTAAILNTKTAKNISLIVGLATIIYAAIN